MGRVAASALSLLVAASVAGCGGRSSLGFFEFEDRESDGGRSVGDGGGPFDAGPDAPDDAGPILPFEGPLDVIGVTELASGELRIITLRDAANSAGDLEIHALNEESGEFELQCEAGQATGARVLRLPREPGEVPPPSDERLLVERSDCGRPPTCPPREVRLIDMECGSVGAPIEDAITWANISPGTLYVLDDFGNLRTWDAVTGESEIIATDVGQLRFDGNQTIWSTESGEVIRRNLQGEITGRFGTSVSTIWLRPGEDEITFTDEGDVYLWLGGEPAPTLLEADACRPIYANDALLMLSPCETGTLVVVDRDTDERFVVADDVAATPHAQWNDQIQQVSYAVDPDAAIGPSGPIATRPWKDVWVFEPGEMPVHLGQRVSLVRHLGRGRVAIIEDAVDRVGTLSIWTGGAEAEPLINDVIEFDNGPGVHGVLANHDGQAGTLIAVDAETFARTTVSGGVPRRAFQVSGTAPNFVYLTDVDPELGTGTLEAFWLDSEATQVIDRQVTPGFVRVRTPDPGGVVYAVFDGTRSDVRFAFFEDPG